MEISGRALTDWYYVGPGGLWWSSVLNLALTPQRVRPDTQPEHQDPVSHTVGVPSELEKLACSVSPSALHIRISCCFFVLPQRQCSTEKNNSLENSHSSEMAFFSFVLSRVSLAHRGPRAEALHPALPTRVPSAEWLPPTLQLRRAICRSETKDTASKMAAGGRVLPLNL